MEASTRKQDINDWINAMEKVNRNLNFRTKHFDINELMRNIMELGIIKGNE